MGRKQNRLYRWQDLCSKKQITSRWNTQWQPQPTRCWTPRTTQNDGINQEKLLVARNMQRCMKIHPRMSGISTEQGATHEESGTFTPLTHTKNTMGGNQHWCHRTCKGTTLGLGLVTWVGFHLRAIVSPIAFPLSSFLSHDWHVVWSCISNIGLCENTS